MKFLEDNIEARRRNFLEIEEAVKRNSDFIPVDHVHLDRISPFAIPFVCKTEDSFRKYTSVFSGAGVEIRPMIAGNMQYQPFYAKYVNARCDAPGADSIHNCGFYCGNYPELASLELETLKSCVLG